MATATSWIVGQIAGILDGTVRITTTPDFTNSGFVTSYAIVFAASSILTVVLWLLAVIKRAVAGISPLRAMSEATGPLWIAVAATAFTPVVIAGLVSITDALTDAIATPIGKPSGYLRSLAAQIQPNSIPFLSIILDLLVFAAAVMLVMELVVRAALLYMAVAVAPAFYAGLVDRALWHHIKKWAGAILAFDFAKPITVLTLALAKSISSTLSSNPSTNLSSLMTGMTILYISVYASTRVYQFIPFIGDELNSWGMRDLTFRALKGTARLGKAAGRAAQAARTARATAADRMRDGINAHANRESGIAPPTASDKPNLAKPIAAAAAGAVGIAAAAHAAPLIAGAAAAHGAGAAAAGIAAHSTAAAGISGGAGLGGGLAVGAVSFRGFKGMKQIQINQHVGNAYRDHVADALRAMGRIVITDAQDRKLNTYQALGDNRIFDMSVFDSTGKFLGVIEVKSGDEGKDAEQEKKDEYLRGMGLQISYVFDDTYNM